MVLLKTNQNWTRFYLGFFIKSKIWIVYSLPSVDILKLNETFQKISISKSDEMFAIKNATIFNDAKQINTDTFFLSNKKVTTSTI